MNASELSRQLLFYGYEEVTDYLKNSPMNRYLYKMFLRVLPQCDIKVPMVTLFNEIYYQCVRVNYDGAPGVDIQQRYLAEEENWLQSKRAADLVFAVVWAVLKVKRDQTFHEDCFLSQLDPLMGSNEMCDVAHTIQTEFRYVGMEVPNPFPTLTCPLDGIPKFEVVKDRHRSLDDIIHASVESKLGLDNQFFELQEHTTAWMTVTSNYSHAVIEKLVRLYSKPEDQLELIDRIQKTLPRDEIIKQDGFIKDLVSRIKTGNFESDGAQMVKNEAENGELQVTYYAALYRDSLKKEKDVVEELKQERDSLLAQIEALKKIHEMEMARMEAKYKAEVQSIKEERNKLAHEPAVKAEPEAISKPKELTLTLSEIAVFVKDRFSSSGANEICTMLYGKAAEHNFLGEDTFKVIDGIVPAVLKRDVPHTKIDIPTAQQVNINPQQVINQAKEEDKD